MLELNAQTWLLAFLPLLVLLVTMIGFKWSAPRAGIVAWVVALLCSLIFFGADGFVLGIGCAKGLSLSLFVLTIIWSAVYMYNLIERLGGIETISKTITNLVKPSLGQALLLAWVLSGFVQGIAGFGVPVAVVAPLMLMLGFPAVTAATSVLVGHAWAVSFGSMGSSYYTIQLVTGIAGPDIGPAMAIMFALPIVATGFSVAIITGGWQNARRGAFAIILIGSVVSFFVWLMVFLGAAQIASIVPGLIGCGMVWLLSKTSLLGEKAAWETPPDTRVFENRINVHMAFFPYYLLIILTVLSQVPVIEKATDSLYFGINYPGLRTSLGYIVEPAEAFAKIRLFNHPAPLILAATLLTFLVFKATGRWKNGAGVTALKKTVKQCLPTSLGIVTMVMMALVMTSVGMIEILAQGIAKATGIFFPIFSPYIGVLGCFMTGSNTNSNVMFGALQMETALTLGINPIIIAAAQSIGGSLGSAIAPTKVLIGSTVVKLDGGKESVVMRKTMPYCFVIVLLVGLEAWLASYILW